MIKRILTVTATLLLIPLFNIQACANENADAQQYYDEQFAASGASELSDYLDKETKDYLEKIGCSEADKESILSFSLKSVFDVLLDMLRTNVAEPLKGCLTACGAVMLVSVCAGFFPDDEKTKGVLNLICGSFVTVSVFVPAVSALRSGVSAMTLCAGFEKALIPVLAAIVTVSGKPASALSVHGLTFSAAQFLEAFSSETVMTLVGICGALGITGAIFPTLRLTAVSDTIRKFMTTLLGSAAGLFSGFLAMKSVLASSVDGMALKGVKLAATTFIPVIGGAIGEVFTSVAGSLSLVRNAVGIYAIVAFFIITLPAVVNLALWVISLRLSCIVSDMLDCKGCSEIIKSIAFIFSMMNIILILCAAVFIVSAGVTVFIGSGE